MKGVLMCNLQHYFRIKAKIFADFQICISVPLKDNITKESKFKDSNSVINTESCPVIFNYFLSSC